jgi:opacity protein-like surface antigen
MRGVVFFIVFFLCCNPVNAQGESKFYFLLSGGIALPTAPDVFDEVWRTGVNLGGGVGYRVSHRFSVLARVNYDRFQPSEHRMIEYLEEEAGVDLYKFGPFEFSGADASIVSVSGELKISVLGHSEKTVLYLIGGLGVAHHSLRDVVMSLRYFEIKETIEGESETAACVTFGGGVDVPLAGRFKVFVETRYQTSFTEEDRTVHTTFAAGVRITGWW